MSLKKLRKSCKLTQTKAARLVHCSLRQWQKYEAGELAMPKCKEELFLLKAKDIAAQLEREKYKPIKDFLQKFA